MQIQSFLWPVRLFIYIDYIDYIDYIAWTHFPLTWGVYITSGPPPQVASSAAHMSARTNKREKKQKRGKQKTKKEHGVGFELGSSDSQSVRLTIRPWEHEATGLTAHKHTYIHVLSYGGQKKMAAIPELLWEKTGELSDGCFIQALVGASRSEPHTSESNGDFL